jgi:hypothetical protein
VGSTDPRPRLVDAARPACAGLGGEPPNGFDPIRQADHRIRVASPDASHRFEPCDPTPWVPAEAEAPSDTSRSTSRGLTGQGPAGFRRPAPPVWRFTRTRRAIRWVLRLFRDTAPATRASPQPDPLGHLMSRDRGASDGESDAVRPRCLLAEASWCGEPPSITPREPSRSRMNASATGPRGPARDPLSRITTNRAEGRFTRASAKKSEIGCTRGAFHRRATQTRYRPGFRPGFARQVGPFPQIVTNLWRTCGAVAYWQTHAPTRWP